MTTPNRRHFWPDLAYNPVTAVGIFLALFAAAAIVIFYVLGLRGTFDNPYTGIFTLVVFPAILVAGLVLIPIGMLAEKRRREHGLSRPFVVDIRNPAHLRALLVFGVGTAIFLLASTIGLYETYNFTESTAFCGRTCHVMEPERAAHAAGAHARVACVHCHVGPGGEDYVKSKLAGARQLWHYARDDYHRPIETPVYTLRPARETCEECHWSDRTHRPTIVTRDHFLSDRENRHWRIELLFNTGAGDSIAPHGAAPGETPGIHWHVGAGNTVRYVAADSSRQRFDAVTWTRQDGSSVTYRRPGVALDDAAVARRDVKGLVRTMDCLDCHNRPAHRYFSPITAVNGALAEGSLDPDIPWIKREAVRALSSRWATTAEAHRGIADRLAAAYDSLGVALPDEAVATVQALHDRHMFPAMEVAWDVYPENQGHLEFDGCFRCHGSPLVDEAGRGIRADCNLCHVLLSQSFVDEPRAGRVRLEPFRHPIDVLGAERSLFCTDCHGGDARLYRAEARAAAAPHAPAAPNGPARPGS